MIAVTGTVQYQPQFHDDLSEAVRTVTAATRAEDGCAAYNITFDLIEPNTVRISELWADEASLAEHMNSAHLAEFMGAIGSMLAGMPTIVRHEIASSKPLFG